MTHTLRALLEVSAQAYQEIHAKLIAAGYENALTEGGELDMHGIALVAPVTRMSEPAQSPQWVHDPVAAVQYARTHALAPGLPAHWHRCDFMRAGVRCARGLRHELGTGETAQHAEPKA